MSPQLYYITDRSQFPGNRHEQERRLLEKVAECAAAGIDLIQLREKDLGIRALEDLAYKAMAALGKSQTRLLINARTDVALACGAHGVHLPANDLSASEARTVFSHVAGKTAVIGVSTHTLDEIASAESHGADFAVFGPVFAKGDTANPEGLEKLRGICHRKHAAAPPMPVFALGGITLENAQQCISAGAAGIAAIRLFQQRDAVKIAERLRQL